MKKLISSLVFLAVFFGILVMPNFTIAQPSYNPTITKVIDITVPTGALPNSTSAIVIAIDGTGSLMPQQQLQCPNPQQYCGGFYGLNSLVSITPAFPPVVVGCGSLGSATQIAQAIASGITANSAANASGYTATASGARVTIQGPGAFQSALNWNQAYDFSVVFFSSEIHQQYGLPVEPCLPVRNLCDDIIGNESYLNPSTGLGIEFTMVIAPDALVADFDSTSGNVVPPNWIWNGHGRVSVSTVPASGFPVSGPGFMRLTTQDPTGVALQIMTRFRFNSATPILKFSYRWFNGEGGPSVNFNDYFQVYIGNGKGQLFASEDTFTPLTAGTRTAEVDIHEVSSWIQPGEPVELILILRNGGQGNTQNDSLVFVDAIQLLPAQFGEGNNPPIGLGSFSFRIDTSTWDQYHWFGGWGAADKKVMPGGIITVQTYLDQYLSPGTGRPFLIMGSWQAYGSAPLNGLPGEANIIGLNFPSSFLIYSGIWGPGFPGIPVFVPPVVVADGLYIQAAILDSTSLNGILVSNRIRHRIE